MNYFMGPDLSHWNTPMSTFGLNALTLTGHFCMIKATQGTYYLDPTFDSRIRKLSGQHHYGVYHYLSKKDGKIIDQVDFFIRTLEKYGIQHEAVICIDWEEGITRGRALELKTAADWCKKRTGRLPMIYIPYSYIDYVPEGLPIWVARWREVSGVSYNLYNTMRSLWPEIRMWQYTDRQESKYWTAPIDYNITHLDPKAWQRIGIDI